MKLEEFKDSLRNDYVSKLAIVKKSYIEERLTNYLKDKQQEFTKDI